MVTVSSWGHAPEEETEVEALAAEKVDRLIDYVRTNGQTRPARYCHPDRFARSGHNSRLAAARCHPQK